MKHALILALVSLITFLGSCGGSGSDVAGAYALDTTTVEAAMKEEFEAMPAEQKQMMEGMLPNLIEEFSKWSITMNADNTFEMTASMMGNEETKKGAWTLEGDKLTLTMEGEEEAQEATFKDGAITMQFDDGPGGGKPLELVMRKQ